MRNRKILATLFLTTLLLTLQSCKKNDPQPDGPKFKITATVKANSPFRWTQGDRIGVWFADGFRKNEPFTNESKGELTATFVNGTLKEGHPADIYAVYPYSDSSLYHLNGKILTFTLPISQKQNFTPIGNKDFDAENRLYACMVASLPNPGSNPVALNFSAVTSFIDFNLKNTPANYKIHSVTLRVKPEFRMPSLPFPLEANVDLNDLSVKTPDQNEYYYISTYITNPQSGDQRLRLSLYAEDYSARKFEIYVMAENGTEPGTCWTFEQTGINFEKNKIYDVNLDFASPDAVQTSAYPIDKNLSISYGSAVKIGTLTWAPVNCGFEDCLYKYGKLYQWGRSRAFGYYNAPSPEFNDIGTTARYEKSTGQYDNTAKANNPDDKLFYVVPELTEETSDWITPSMATDENPVKWSQLRVTYGEKFRSPCPPGWTIPSKKDFEELLSFRHSEWWKNNGIPGMWFGPTANASDPYDGKNIFVEATGWIDPYGVSIGRAGVAGLYWSDDPCLSSEEDLPGKNSSWSFEIWAGTSKARQKPKLRVLGHAIRCVKE